MKKGNLITQYIENVRDLLSGLSEEKIERIVRILHRARIAGKRVYVMGNGGSASAASHFTSDLNKGAISPAWPRFKAVALMDNMPVISAWANDSAYEDIFTEQIENHVGEGDIVIAISGSGNSPNVVKALELAGSKKAITIALTGFDGGKVKDIADTCLVVPGDSMRQVEDVHLILTHVITEYLQVMD